MKNIKLRIRLKLFLIFILIFPITGEAQWLPDVRLTNNSGSSMNCEIASNGTYSYIVWQDNRDMRTEIYFKRSQDGGQNWESDVRLTNPPSNPTVPHIAASGSNVHIVWTDNRDGNFEIYYKRSTNNGTIWSSDTRLTNNSNVSTNPRIAISGSNVYVIWRDTRDMGYSLYFIKSTDGGVSWGSETRLSTESFALVGNPDIGVSGQNIHLIWPDSHLSNLPEMYYKRSTDGGNSWGANTRLTFDSAVSESPAISVSGAYIYITWYELRDMNNEIYFKRSSDNGNTWGNDTRLTFGPLLSQNPAIVSSGELVHIVWHYGVTNFEIYYSKSNNLGMNWTSPVKISTSNSSATQASIATVFNAVNVVWHDTRNGSTNTEIYLALNPTGNVSSINFLGSEIPGKFELNQNYPNPFNPETKIRFTLPASGKISLKVYNILGKEVNSLADNNLNAGIFEYNFNGSALNSGVYFYKLEFTGYDGKYFSDMKKMMLVK
ncbi:MAG TPA: T9SS type A sorting domain-containing protein [Ignavibacteria bacterium]|nr:T9SS type A sorting domain-containing protein [Ignavibacteria bacterium]